MSATMVLCFSLHLFSCAIILAMIAQLKRWSEKQSTIVADMEKLIYNTPRAKLNPKKLAEKSALMKGCLHAAESCATIRDELNGLTQCF